MARRVAILFGAQLLLCQAWSPLPAQRQQRLVVRPAEPAQTPTAAAAVAQSFVMDQLRPYALKLHTRDQSKHGEKKATKPVAKWAPTLSGYLQFLVDSRCVYQTLEEAVEELPALAPLRQTGLERCAALDRDIQWLCAREDAALPEPEVGEAGREYADYLKGLAASSLPAFICNYYNHYFAHTAGGRMIGNKLSEALLDGHQLDFYKWDGDVKELLAAATENIDAIAAAWSADEATACLEETQASFKFSGALLRYLK